MEKFNPRSEEYKKVADLPNEKQSNYIDFENGFVEKEALDAWEFWEKESKRINDSRGFIKKILNLDSKSALDIARMVAEFENNSNVKNETEVIKALTIFEESEKILEKWFKNILMEENRQMIDHHIVEIVFSEDKSARLPSEILLRGINKIYDKKSEQSAALVPLNLSRRDDSIRSDDIERLVINLFESGKLKKGFFYVTDFISTGNTLTQSVEGIKNGIWKLQDRFEKASDIMGFILPIGGISNEYNFHRWSKKYKNEFGEEPIIVAIKSGTHIPDTPLAFRKYHGVEGDYLSSELTAMREEFIEKMSNEFVALYFESIK